MEDASGAVPSDGHTASARPHATPRTPAAAAPASAPSPYPPGTLVGERYEVLREVGRGGMGRVLACRDIRIGREVAVKLLSPGRLDAEGLARFQQEARAAGALNHPNVVAVFDVGTHDGQPFMVSELLRGASLRTRLLDATPGPRQAVEWAMQVARGLAAAHEQGIVHRDLKPDNVFITDEGYAKVLDFGIAKLVDDQRPRTESGTLSSDDLPDRTPHTETGKLLGTVGYMSPEQVRGQPVDHRADVFAFGIVLHEMLSGARAFKRASQVETLYAILNGEPPPLPARLPAELGRLVRRCLEKDPRKRQQSMRDLAFALETLLPKMPEVMHDGPGASVNWRHPALVAALAAGAALALVAGALWLRGEGVPGRGRGAPQVAVAPFVVRAGPQFSYLGEGVAEALASAAAGGRLKPVDARAALSAAGGQGMLDPARGRAFAEGLGAGAFVLGSVLEVQGRLRLQAALYELEKGNRPVVEARAEGEAGQLSRLVDDLARQLKLSPAEAAADPSASAPGGPAGRLERAAASATRSPEALKGFLEGERHLRRGEWPAASEGFRRATKTDPSFALAWYRLAVTAVASEPVVAVNALGQALLLKDLLSPLDRALVEAYDPYFRGDLAEAERRYQEILREHPDEVEAWFQLGEGLFHSGPLHGREASDAEAAFGRAMLFDPERGTPLSHLIDIASLQGQRAVAAPLAERFLAHHSPTPTITLAYRWTAGWASGDEVARAGLLAELSGPAVSVAELRAAFNRAIWEGDGLKHAQGVVEVMRRSESPGAKGDGLARQGVIELARGRQAAGLRALREAAEMTKSDLRISGWLADALALDALPAAEPELAKAKELLASQPDSDQALFLYRRLRGLGALAVRQRDLAGAERIAQALDRAPAPTGSSLSADLALGLRARILRAQGKPHEALALLEKQRLLLPVPQAYEYTLTRVSEQLLRGELLAQTGRLEAALPWLGAVEFYNDLEAIYLAGGYLQQARVEERLGRREAAIGDYESFLRLWDGAEPALRPLADEARARLKALTGR